MTSKKQGDESCSMLEMDAGNKLSNMTTSAVCGAVLLALAGSAQAAVPAGVDPGENVLLQWNDMVLEAIRETHPGPPMVARMLAILNTSTFDAWAAFDSKARGTRLGTTFKAPVNLLNEASKKEAIAYAAYRAAADLFPQPTQQQQFRDLLVQQGYNPSNTTANATTAAGIGNTVANALLAYRHQDKSNQTGNMNGGAPYSDWTGYQPVNTPDQINDPNVGSHCGCLMAMAALSSKNLHGC